MSAICRWRGCKDPRDRHTRGMCRRHYRQQLHSGVYGRRDATAAREHVARLRALGWGYQHIADAAGVSTTVPHKLATWVSRQIWPESEDAILALPLVPYASKIGTDSAGTRRRVQALAWMGWSATEVARRAGTSYSTLSTIILPSRRVSHALALKAAAVYDELSGVHGPSTMAAARAVQLGHAPPAAWDDDTIDDPKARPRGVLRPNTLAGVR